MTGDTFTISVFWSDDDKGYIATVAELPGISAFGETKREAMKEVGVAIQGALAAIEDHKEIGIADVFKALRENFGDKLGLGDKVDPVAVQQELRGEEMINVESVAVRGGVTVTVEQEETCGSISSCRRVVYAGIADCITVDQLSTLTSNALRAMAEITHKEGMEAACPAHKLKTTIEWTVYDGTPESLPEEKKGGPYLVYDKHSRPFVTRKWANGIGGRYWMPAESCVYELDYGIKPGDMWAYWPEAPKAEE